MPRQHYVLSYCSCFCFLLLLVFVRINVRKREPPLLPWLWFSPPSTSFHPPILPDPDDSSVYTAAESCLPFKVRLFLLLNPFLLNSLHTTTNSPRVTRFTPSSPPFSSSHVSLRVVVFIVGVGDRLRRVARLAAVATSKQQSSAQAKEQATQQAMNVTAEHAGGAVVLELDEGCRSVAALRRIISAALPDVREDGFDVTVQGRAVEDVDVCGLEEGATIQVVESRRAVALAALRAAGRDVSEDGLWDGMFEAVKNGEFALCEQYLDAGCDVNALGEGDAPLHYAAFHCRPDLCTLLLQRGADANKRVQRGHNRSFQPYSPMGWRVALRSGRVHKLCQRLRSSGSRYARHRSHIRQLRRARTIRHGPGRASGRANCCGDGPGRPRRTRGRHTRRPGGRVVCTGIDNPGSRLEPTLTSGTRTLHRCIGVSGRITQPSTPCASESRSRHARRGPRAHGVSLLDHARRQRKNLWRSRDRVARSGKKWDGLSPFNALDQFVKYGAPRMKRWSNPCRKGYAGYIHRWRRCSSRSASSRSLRRG